MTTPSRVACIATTSTNRTTALRRLVLVGPALALLLAGCGGGSTGAGATTSAASSPATSTPAATSSAPAVDVLKGKSAKEVVDLAKGALLDTPSVLVSAKVVEGGETTVIDIASTKAGQAEGTIALGSVANFKLKVVGDDAYLSGDKGFWTIFGGNKSVPADVWLKTRKNDPKYVFVWNFASPQGITSKLDQGGELALVPGLDINGTPTVGVKGKDGVLYVAAQGAPLPLRITAIDDPTQAVTFSNFDAPLTVTPPPAAKIVAS